MQAMGDVEQRAPGIHRQHAEDVGGARGEPLDAHAAVDKHRGDVGGGDQVGQVIVDLVGLFDLAFQLEVDGQQFFVDRLQFFLAGFQLFGGRTQFFVDRLHFFVGSLELFAGDFRLFDGVLQVQFGALQFALQVGQHLAFRL
ncbi:hypothetical protein D3C85_1192070 [compost metagenome]